MSFSRNGFTLVELSIVLVIIGLLVGGVLTGQSLIRAAELRSVTSQEQRYIAAVQTFRDKYFALPGDMTNAQSYWGVANATAATCVTTSSAGSALTCNGDGNGQVLLSAGSQESFRFWQHLANAGLIEGNYSGVSASGSVTDTSSANSPVGRISSTLWFAGYAGTLTSDGSRFDGNYGNVLEFGGLFATTDPYTGVLKPEEAYNIDTKMDDGKPATGFIVARTRGGFSGTSCTDATASSTLTANYLLTNTTLACALNFRNAF